MGLWGEEEEGRVIQEWMEPKDKLREKGLSAEERQAMLLGSDWQAAGTSIPYKSRKNAALE